MRAFGSLTEIIRESKKYQPKYIVAYKGKVSKSRAELQVLPSEYTAILEVVECPHLVEERTLVILDVRGQHG